jgi:hypothetical protein
MGCGLMGCVCALMHGEKSAAATDLPPGPAQAAERLRACCKVWIRSNALCQREKVRRAVARQ